MDQPARPAARAGPGQRQGGAGAGERRGSGSATGCDDGAVWGECQGSGSKPYQVQVELAEPAFKCSCPSRKFPCKHGLGLMLIFASADNAIAKSRGRSGSRSGSARRAQKAEKKKAAAEAPPKPVDEAAQAKRREKRLARTAEGLAAVKVWIEDLVRGGIATAPTRGLRVLRRARPPDDRRPGARRRPPAPAARRHRRRRRGLAAAVLRGARVAVPPRPRVRADRPAPRTDARRRPRHARHDREAGRGARTSRR